VFSTTTIYQWNDPTALVIGEFKKFTSENAKQVKELIKDIGQVCIQVRTTKNDPTVFKKRKEKIKNKLNESGISYKAKYIIIEVPNISTICQIQK